MKFKINEKGQAVAGKTQLIDKKAFDKIEGTQIRWLGNAGIMINSKGTNVMIDPLLEGFDMPLLIEMPMLPESVPFLDAVLVTHIDNDHFSRVTCRKLKEKCKEFHAPYYVAQQMEKELQINGIGHGIHDTFQIGNITFKLTPAWHNWQNDVKKYQYREWKKEEYCGYWMETEDGTIWLPGDSRLLEEHLHMSAPDVILFDFADNDWHITLKGAIQLANTYHNSDLICIHWGCVDAPDMTPFNGNPQNILDHVVNPNRVKILAPGEVYEVRSKKNE